LQGSREPIEGRHDEGVAGLDECQARGELGPVAVAAGLLFREGASAAGSFERVELTLQLLPAGGDPGVADLDVGQHRRLGGEQVRGFQRGRHAHDLLRKRRPPCC